MKSDILLSRTFNDDMWGVNIDSLDLSSPLGSIIDDVQTSVHACIEEKDMSYSTSRKNQEAIDQISNEQILLQKRYMWAILSWRLGEAKKIAYKLATDQTIKAEKRLRWAICANDMNLAKQIAYYESHQNPDATREERIFWYNKWKYL